MDPSVVYFFYLHSIPIKWEFECLIEELLWCLNPLHGDLLKPEKDDLSMTPGDCKMITTSVVMSYLSLLE